MIVDFAIIATKAFLVLFMVLNLAGVLGWSPQQEAREVEHYEARVAAERASQEQPDDETADSARMGAPEIVPLA